MTDRLDQLCEEFKKLRSKAKKARESECQNSTTQSGACSNAEFGQRQIPKAPFGDYRGRSCVGEEGVDKVEKLVNTIVSLRGKHEKAPALFKSDGFAIGLSRLIRAYVSRGGSEHLPTLLSIFQLELFSMRKFGGLYVPSLDVFFEVWAELSAASMNYPNEHSLVTDLGRVLQSVLDSAYDLAPRRGFTNATFVKEEGLARINERLWQDDLDSRLLAHFNFDQENSLTFYRFLEMGCEIHPRLLNCILLRSRNSDLIEVLAWHSQINNDLAIGIIDLLQCREAKESLVGRAVWSERADVKRVLEGIVWGEHQVEPYLRLKVGFGVLVSSTYRSTMLQAFHDSTFMARPPFCNSIVDPIFLACFLKIDAWGCFRAFLALNREEECIALLNQNRRNSFRLLLSKYKALCEEIKPILGFLQERENEALHPLDEQTGSRQDVFEEWTVTSELYRARNIFREIRCVISPIRPAVLELSDRSISQSDRSAATHFS